MLFRLLWLKIRLGFLEKVIEVSAKLAKWAYDKGIYIMKDELNNVINKVPECCEKEKMENMFKDLGL